jgi:uncharacterized protein (TIGR02300 family)
VVKAELGTKRTCPSCAARFYDLLKNPIVCPKCGANFVAASILPSKGDMPAMAPAPKPRVTEEADDMEVADVELVSLEDAEAPDVADDDETAGIEDVDLGDEAGGDEAEDDTFLVEEEEEGDSMSGLLDTGGKEEDEES